MKSLADATERERIATDLTTNLVVEAAAGTGKTTALVTRLVGVLESGADVGHVVAVTFTDKAAGELKLRLRSGLEEARWKSGGAARRNLERALSRLEEAHISTFHTFAAELVRHRPIAAGVDPGFTTLDESGKRALFGQAFDTYLQDRLARPSPTFSRALARIRKGSRVDDLKYASADLLDLRHLPAAWTEREWDRHGLMAAARAALREVVTRSEKPSVPHDRFYVQLEPIRKAMRALDERSTLDEVEATLVSLIEARETWRPDRSRSRYSARGTREAITEALAHAEALLLEFARHANAELAVLLRTELMAVTSLYDGLKQRRAALDFDDLLLLARKLLAQSPEARRTFGQRTTHIFVDEFQDTDPVQASIVLFLASPEHEGDDPFALPLSAGKLFIVGDPKQSIYRFRNADLGTYARVKERVVDEGGAVVNLTTNWRTVPNIASFVNATFSAVMVGDRDAHSPAYVPIQAAREGEPSQPSVIALCVAEPYATTRVARPATLASAAETIAAFIDWLVRESAMTVVEPSTGERVKIESRHVCLLFRQFDGWTGSIVTPFSDALLERGIPNVLVGGRTFHDRDEVMFLRAALSAIEWPTDTLSVYSTLKNLFGLTDAALFEYREAFGSLSPLYAPITAHTEATEEVRSALSILARLHRRRNKRPIAETVWDLIETAGLHVSLALWPSGEQALANALELLELAKSHENQGGLSWKSFVESLHDMAKERRVAEASIVEEESEGVRLMTVHKAKGLEFPVVILADLTTKAARPPTRHVDISRGLGATRLAGCDPWDLLDAIDLEVQRESAEGLRLLYVAATRARDMLVVPCVADELEFPADGWITPLVRTMVSASPSELPTTCPPMTGDATMTRPRGAEPPSRTRRPGGYTLSDGTSVVFWDPHVLPWERSPVPGIRHAEVLAAGVDLVRQEEAARDRERFTSSRDATQKEGSTRSLEIITVTRRSHDEDLAREDVSSTPVEIVRLPRRVERPGGKRFGTLVHQTLATIELSCDPSQVVLVAEALGRLFGATPLEVEHASIAVTTALTHELWLRARAAEELGLCRRETPITLTMHGELVEGVVDLAFSDGDSWTVVDFKTDRPERESPFLAAYEAQVRVYALAIERVTKLPTKPMLWFL